MQIDIYGIFMLFLSNKIWLTIEFFHYREKEGVVVVKVPMSGLEKDIVVLAIIPSASNIQKYSTKKIIHLYKLDIVLNHLPLPHTHVL
jgi:hypothetical protein